MTLYTGRYHRRSSVAHGPTISRPGRLAAALVLAILLGVLPLAAEKSPHPLRVNESHRIGQTSNPILALVWEDPGEVSRVLVTFSGAVVWRALRNEPLDPRQNCLVIFDGRPTRGMIIKFPVYSEGDYCRPHIRDFRIVTWGSGSYGGSFYACDMYEVNDPVNPVCCRVNGICDSRSTSVYGGIAYSSLKMLTGNTWNWGTEDEAARNAVKFCDNPDCRLLTTFNNCVALALASDGSFAWSAGNGAYAWSTAGDIAGARRAAVAECNPISSTGRCNVFVEFCADGSNFRHWDDPVDANRSNQERVEQESIEISSCNDPGVRVVYNLIDPPPYSGVTPVCKDASGQLWMALPTGMKKVTRLLPGPVDGQTGCHNGASLQTRDWEYKGRLCPL